MRGTVTNLRIMDNGYIEVTITAVPDILAAAPNGLRHVVSMVQVPVGKEPKVGSIMEVTLNVIG